MSPKPIPNVPSPWLELAAIVMRKQRPSVLAAASYPAEARFPVWNGPVSSILVPLVLVGLFCDAPLSLVLVALCHPSNPALIHVAVLAIGLMTLGWAIAIRSVLRSLPHVVSSEALWIGGIRHSGVVPKAAIERIQAIQGSRHEWMTELGLRRDQVILASGFDPPNLAVEVSATEIGSVRIGGDHQLSPARRWILLYADSPATFIEAALLGRLHKAGEGASQLPAFETE